MVERKEKKENNFNAIKIIIILLIISWIVAGILGFIMSLVCFNYYGYKIEKIIGLLIASFFFGPLYWIYYIYMDNYCVLKPIIALKNKLKIK